MLQLELLPAGATKSKHPGPSESKCCCCCFSQENTCFCLHFGVPLGLNLLSLDEVSPHPSNSLPSGGPEARFRGLRFPVLRPVACSLYQMGVSGKASNETRRHWANKVSDFISFFGEP